MVFVLLVTLLLVVIIGPFVMVATGTKRATACFRQVGSPRGPALPDCMKELHWFALPSRVPWTYGRASYRAEELIARAAMVDYVDGAVGRPDRSSLQRASVQLDVAASTVKKGSQRVALDELGSAIGVPYLGRHATQVGDRRTLLDRPERWGDWHVRMAAVHAALTEGDLDQAVKIAKLYAGWDPRDEDLRTTVASLLCLGGDPTRGIELLTLVQHDRATRRYAAMARNWGDVRGLLVACAALGSVEPPERPGSVDAGQDDAVAMRVVQQIRIAMLNNKEADSHRLQQMHGVARELLMSSERPVQGRLGLFAAVVASDNKLDAAAAVELAPREGEPQLDAGPPLAMDWFATPGLVDPVVPASMLDVAAKRTLALAADSKLSTEQRATLHFMAGALGFKAARTHALDGNQVAALDALERFGRLALWDSDISGAQDVLVDDAALALARSSVLYVAGDRVQALEALGDPSRFDKAHPLVRVPALLQRADLLASVDRGAEAAKVAVAADEAVAHAIREALQRPDHEIQLGRLRWFEMHARWLRLALGHTTDTTPLRADSPTLSAADAGGVNDPWPWVGFANVQAPWARADQTAFSQALVRWNEARKASPEHRRAFRYASLRRRGDAPSALAPYVAMAAELLGEGEGDMDVWLDAFLALDAPRFSHRQMAFVRAQAARWRNDAATAARWEKRYEALRTVAADPTRAEIARYLGI